MIFAVLAMLGVAFATPEFMKCHQGLKGDLNFQCKDLEFTVYNDSSCTESSPSDTQAQMLNYNNT